MKLTIFTDGGSRGNPGDAGIGIVVYKNLDKDVEFEQIKYSEVIYEHSGFIGSATNNEAEYKALIKALEWLSENSSGISEVDFYLDSKLVVEQINKNWKIKDDRMRDFANKSWEILKTVKCNVKFFHIKREKNKEADKLVNQALDSHQL